MRKQPLRELIEAIKHSEPFNGSSVSAKLKDGAYTVYSYSTIMATFSHGVLVWFDDASYSNTTAKLQHLIRAEYMNGIPKTHKVHIV